MGKLRFWKVRRPSESHFLQPAFSSFSSAFKAQTKILCMNPRSSEHGNPTECGIVGTRRIWEAFLYRLHNRQGSPIRGGLFCAMGGHVAGGFCLQTLDEIWVIPYCPTSTSLLLRQLLPCCHPAYTHHPSLGKAPCWRLAQMIACICLVGSSIIRRFEASRSWSLVPEETPDIQYL